MNIQKIISGFRTQAEAAQALGVSMGSVSAWSRGLGKPSKKTIKRIHLKMSKRAMIGDEYKPDQVIRVSGDPATYFKREDKYDEIKSIITSGMSLDLKIKVIKGLVEGRL